MYTQFASHPSRTGLDFSIKSQIIQNITA